MRSLRPDRHATVGTGTPLGPYGFRPHVATLAALLTRLLRRHHHDRGAGCGHFVGPALRDQAPAVRVYRTVQPDLAGFTTGQELPRSGYAPKEIPITIQG